MQTITTIGFDIAKSVFQVHGLGCCRPSDRLPAVEASPGHSVGRLKFLQCKLTLFRRS
jgi:hypothetical protein